MRHILVRHRNHPCSILPVAVPGLELRHINLVALLRQNASVSSSVFILSQSAQPACKLLTKPTIKITEYVRNAEVRKAVRTKRRVSRHMVSTQVSSLWHVLARQADSKTSLL